MHAHCWSCGHWCRCPGDAWGCVPVPPAHPHPVRPRSLSAWGTGTVPMASACRCTTVPWKPQLSVGLSACHFRARLWPGSVSSGHGLAPPPEHSPPMGWPSRNGGGSSLTLEGRVDPSLKLRARLLPGTYYLPRASEQQKQPQAIGPLNSVGPCTMTCLEVSSLGVQVSQQALEHLPDGPGGQQAPTHHGAEGLRLGACPFSDTRPLPDQHKGQHSCLS